MRNNGITSPQRQWINYAPAKHVEDHYGAQEDEHDRHLWRVHKASRGYGFPVGPCAPRWPPQGRAR